MTELTEDQLVEIITRKLVALRGKDIAEEYESNGLDDWHQEVDAILSGEQPMTATEQLAFGLYVSQWRAIPDKKFSDD
jgi:hypothetical protein